MISDFIFFAFISCFSVFYYIIMSILYLTGSLKESMKGDDTRPTTRRCIDSSAMTSMHYVQEKKCCIRLIMLNNVELPLQHPTAVLFPALFPYPCPTCACTIAARCYSTRFGTFGLINMQYSSDIARSTKRIGQLRCQGRSTQSVGAIERRLRHPMQKYQKYFALATIKTWRGVRC